MKIAHIILAHRDFEHIERLVKRLATFSDIYIHIDSLVDQSDLVEALKDIKNCFFLQNRIHCGWGCWNGVVATVELLRATLDKEYDRITFLQGADYPIKKDTEIVQFYNKFASTEFIRGCFISNSKDSYFWPKCRYLSFRNNSNVVKKILTKFLHMTKIKMRSGYITSDEGTKLGVYWGGALWSVTGECAKYIVEYYDSHPKFNRWFYYTFAPDELYFVTVIMNSPYKTKTMNGGAEPENRGTTNWRCLHKWEYLPGRAKIYTIKDIQEIASCSELYIRKVCTDESTELLNELDDINKI